MTVPAKTKYKPPISIRLQVIEYTLNHNTKGDIRKKKEAKILRQSWEKAIGIDVNIRIKSMTKVKTPSIIFTLPEYYLFKLSKAAGKRGKI